MWRNKHGYERSLRDLQDAMKTLLKRIATVLPASVTSNVKEVIMNILKAFLDGVFMLEMYTSKNGMGML